MDQSGATYWTDQELLDKYRKEHENEWLGILLDRYLHLIFGVCMKYLKNEEDARDHTQQICLKVLKTLPRHQVTYFKSWLYQVTKNHCLMALRHSRRIHIQPLSDQQLIAPAEGSGSENDLLEHEEQYTQLYHALASLNEAQRRCLDLFYFKKKTYQGVSEATGYSLSQVKSYIQNGKRNLKLTLERMATEGNRLPGKLPTIKNENDNKIK